MIITRTPFRISFFGGGTDIPKWYTEHGGNVLSTTIDKYLYIQLREMPPFWDFRNRFVYGSKTETVDNINLIEHPSIRETLKFLNIDGGIDMHYNTDIPARSGIGSSSSFTVGFLNALYGQMGKLASDQKLASDSIHIEQDLIHEAVGCQDQITAAYGGFNQIVFRRDGTFEVNPMTLRPQRIEELNDHLVLLFTGFQRSADAIEREKINNMNSHQEDLTYIQGYVNDAVNILNSNTDIAEFGALLHETWMKKRNLSDKVSNSKIDDIYDIGRKNGAIGGKLLGAGGGGFMLLFVQPHNREALLKSLSEYIHIPFSFENLGTQTIYYREGV
ncbi:MAG: kinase [Dehalobacter sp.]|nr:kinase [Dehalobacter sp.]